MTPIFFSHEGGYKTYPNKTIEDSKQIESSPTSFSSKHTNKRVDNP